MTSPDETDDYDYDAAGARWRKGVLLVILVAVALILFGWFKSARAADSTRVVVGTAHWCGPCAAFEQRNGKGNDSIEFIYADVEGPQPVAVTAEEWRHLTYRATHPSATIDYQIPLAIWPSGKMQNGRRIYYTKSVNGMSTVDVARWVKR